MKILLNVAALLVIMWPAFTLSADDEERQFFEQKIRPVLVEHCYSCHSNQAVDAKKLKGELLLDSAAGLAAGGESGAVLVKGNSAESLLIKALKYDGIEMPPSGKLPAETVVDFAKWIDKGALDPRVGEAPVKPKREISIEEGKKWWSFQPISDVALPDSQHPIDGWIRSAQHAHGLKQNDVTTKEKLIRRAYLDLIGLPPTPEQIAAFANDVSPEAYEKVIDELLASSSYGERWARHWLDAARFAESGGYEFDGFRPGAFHYRDWVIRALNSDMPYDQFVRMQIAGDLLQPDAIEGAAATGFLVAGPYPGQITTKTVERIRYDQLDDMMMTIGGSMLGLTLGCARCHEHKYDPIPHQDYYALAASLARTAHGPRSLEVDPLATQLALEKHQTDHEPLVLKLKSFASQELPKRFESWRKAELKKQPESSRWQSLEPVAIEAERSYLKELPGGIVAHDGMLTPGTNAKQRGQRRKVREEEQYRLTFHTHQKNVQSMKIDAFSDKSLPQRGPGLNNDGSFQLAEITVTARPLDSQAKEEPLTVKLKPVFAAFEDKDQPLANAVDGKPATAWIVKTTAKKDNAAIFEFESPFAGFPAGTEFVVELKFLALGIGRLRVSISVEPNPATWAGDVSPQHVAELRAIVAANGDQLPASMPVSLAESMVRWFAPFDIETANVFRAVRDHTAATPRPNLSEVYTTIAGGQDVFYLRRGEIENKQDKAEPGFLQVLWRGIDTKSSSPTEPPQADTPVDPRAKLAKCLTDIEFGAGPLLARVIVNRLWQHHFGQGIVGTPNDFGHQGEKPTHPELLEVLAGELVRGDWKLKPLHRLLMLSKTYQQSHEIEPENLKLDPTNRYLWYFQPRRLEAETIRDSLLAVGGNLDPKMFGPSVLDTSLRRSVYLRVKRSELLPVMTMFDAPEPTQSIGERSITTVPTQALAMMNSTFVRQQAEKLSERIRFTKDDPIETVIDRGYQLALGRIPNEPERVRMVAFIEQQRAASSGDAEEADKHSLVEFCHVLLCLNEFIYID